MSKRKISASVPRKMSKRSRNVRRTRRHVYGVAPTVQRGLCVSDSQLVKLRYTDRITLDPALGLQTSYTYRCNSINDPDYTGVGTQPTGHDQWGVFYSRYTVVGATITATFIPRVDTPTNAAGIGGIHQDEDVTAPSDVLSAMSQKHTKWGYMGTSSSGRYPKVVMKFDPKSFFGVKDIADNHQLGALFGANPSRAAYWNVFLAPAASTDDLSVTAVIITIDYTCLFTHVKDIPDS